MLEKAGLGTAERQGGSRICEIRTYDFGDCSTLAETNVDHRKPWGRLAEPGEESLELLGSAHVVVKQQVQQASLIVVNGDPERESAQNLKVFVGEVFRDGLGERLRGLASSRLSLQKQGFWKHVLITINNTKDKGALVLERSQLTPRTVSPPSRTHGP